MGYYAGSEKPAHHCSHVRFGLRGCTRMANHVQQGKPHHNMWSPDHETWEDKDGRYVETKEDWVAMVDQMGKK